MSDAVTDKGLGRKHIIDSINGSLERLNLDYADIFYYCRYDPETELIETVEAFEDSICLGKITYWGTSMWTADQITEAVRLCESRGWHRPIINQPLYNMLSRGIEEEILPSCGELGIGTAKFSPLSHGVLTGKYSGGKIPAGSRGSNEKQNRWMKNQISDLELSVEDLQIVNEKFPVA